MDTPCCTVPLPAVPLDCCLSPVGGLLAAGLVTGHLQLASFTCPPAAADGGGGSQLSFQLGTSVAPPAADGDDDDEDDAPSCRAVCFVQAGGASVASTVLAGYADKTVRSYDTSTGKRLTVYSDEHDEQLSRVYSLDPHTFVSGDEDGLVAMWDSRQKGGRAVYRYAAHTDTITDFAVHTNREGSLVVSSADATLSVHDLRKRKVLARSEEDGDDELLSLAVVKGGKKVVAGTQSGVLALYSWGYWNDCSDRFPGHPESVSAMLAFDEDTILTGSCDGAVRVVGVLPNRLLGILGQHSGDLEIERLALSADRRVLASTSHDCAVKLWDLGVLHDDDDDGDGDEEGEEGAEEGVEGGVEEGAEGADEGAVVKGKRRGGGEEEGGEGEGEGEEEEGSSGEWSEGDEDSDSDSEAGEGEDGEGADSDGEGAGEGEAGGSGSDEEADAEVAEAEGARQARKASGKAAGTSSGAKRAASPGAAAAKEAKEAKKAGKSAAAKLAAALDAAGKGTAAGASAGAGGAGGAGSDGDDGDGSGGSGSGDDSDSDGGGRKRKRNKRERTRWTKHAEKQKKPGGNFFADLL
ncbi:hypothetical protein HYH03_011778 [Edaphochlamys debaryana]|uniref:Uncharacterized protein n=1 Tax=Edaphochlamys debaryana TaxID=47281 RepID=A0A835XU12_9CHLO|nr:hypothetical protein HYH03_011778 [Edaphochlamys debaryana]|eukprot:KAG2489667.1 hypothetical protein HYH03_011778 [Edaphochlamys debaryana]